MMLYTQGKAFLGGRDTSAASPRPSNAGACFTFCRGDGTCPGPLPRPGRIDRITHISERPSKVLYTAPQTEAPMPEGKPSRTKAKGPNA